MWPFASTGHIRTCGQCRETTEEGKETEIITDYTYSYLLCMDECNKWFVNIIHGYEYLVSGRVLWVTMLKSITRTGFHIQEVMTRLYTLGKVSFIKMLMREIKEKHNSFDSSCLRACAVSRRISSPNFLKARRKSPGTSSI